jgi:hypothetical protein
VDISQSQRHARKSEQLQYAGGVDHAWHRFAGIKADDWLLVDGASKDLNFPTRVVAPSIEPG